eukprot:TRINITY_DN1929_c0_g1_i3.p1 TRINITY_DN1929_c0_g1~~TRINITY_DN1929_c0_g1_i3.p1  ORF type:complete len:326 (+),score=83.47 TRINITY_DN1929_c0_g1_i3:67-1044(+)
MDQRTAPASPVQCGRAQRRLLAVCGSTENWYEIMGTWERRERLPFQLVVEQATWDDIDVRVYSDSGPEIQLQASRHPIADAQKKERRFIPDFVLIRNFCRSVGHIGYTPDFRNKLFALYVAGIPMMNSFHAHYAELERPIMYAGLAEIARRLGKAFPLIPQSFYPDHSAIMCPPPAPFVVKVSFPHAGFGKMLIKESDDMQDLAGIIGLHTDYCTAEQFVESEYELRVIKIGNVYRAHKRIGASWKVNTGASMREDVPMTERYKLWADEASKMFGGMDMLALDAIVDKNGNEYILEVNGSALGLAPEKEIENLRAIRDLVVQRMT